MWNSIEALTRIFYASQWATAIFGGLTALAIVIGIVVSVRKDTLVTKQEEDRARQSHQMQTGQNQTIDSLKHELEKHKSVAEKVPGLENRIRELTAQRSLSPEQKGRLMAALRASPQHHLIIMHAGDLETQSYADEIKACISSSGWVIDRTPFRYVVHSVPGLHISVQDVNHPPDGAKALLNALMSIELKVSTGSDETKKPDEIWLWVGPKELPRPE